MNYYTITYGLPLIALLLTTLAQVFVSSSYSKYSNYPNKKKITGKDTARDILNRNGLNYINIVETSGYLTDHYDPKNKVIRLSKQVYNGKSVGAIAIASHECGHAIQDKDNYTFMRLRSSLVPIVNFSSYAGYFAILLGMLFGSLNLIWLGILAEVAILLFQVVTLPVEIDASKRALNEIKKANYLVEEEIKYGKTMLTAAALTYVASIATTIIQILRLILMTSRRDD